MECENCGKDHDGTFGSGRFCSWNCSNRRSLTEEQKQKIREKLTIHPDKFCEVCGKKLSNKRSSMCRPCLHASKVGTGKYGKIARDKVAYTSNRRKAIRISLIKELGGKCSICGYSKTNSALEFHHLNPVEKDFVLSNSGLNKSLKKIREEVAKCILVCANCHRELHEQLET